MVDPNPARGMPLQLQRYWLAGKGAAKIRWGMPHDFDRCVRNLRKYFPKNPQGLCNILHQKALGAPPGKGHGHTLTASMVGTDDRRALVAAQELIDRQPQLGTWMWAGSIAPFSMPTGEPGRTRIFEPGSLSHRILPLPYDFRERQGRGHDGANTVGRILGITYGPDPMGRDHCWAWGDYLDEEIIPNVRTARYLAEMGVSAPSVDPGGRVVASINPATGVEHYTQFVIGGITQVPIPAYENHNMVALSIFNTETGDWDDDNDMPWMDPDEDECGCGGRKAMVASINPNGWKGLPLAMRETVFDNDDAVKRITAWANGGQDTERMRKAFMYYNPQMPPHDPTSYRMPVGDIINGRLTLIYHAIYAAAALLSGAHGGLPNVPEKDIAEARNTISEIYAVMAREFNDSSVRAPWDRSAQEGVQLAMTYAATEPYGDVKYADPGYRDNKKRYPIDTPDHIRAAWAYINVPKNAGEYTPEQLKQIKARIVAAAKKAGIQISEDSMTASMRFPINPPKAWFEDPKLTRKTKLTVTEDGHVFGHLAAWNECHRDVTNRECVMAPRSRQGYAPFHLGTVLTAEGEEVHVGKIVMDTRHANIGLGYTAAAVHYDNTGDEVAIVRCGEDDHGIWFSGSIVPEADERKVAKLRRSPLSGDWRREKGSLELTAALAVNAPAFPIYSMDNEDVLALTAAGTVWFDDEPDPMDDFAIDTPFVPPTGIIMDAIKDQVGAYFTAADEQAELERRERLKDLLEDEEIYAQRERSERARNMFAADTGAAPGAVPAPAVGGVPAPAAPGAPAPGAAAPSAPGDPAAAGGESATDAAGMDIDAWSIAAQADARFSILEDNGTEEAPGGGAATTGAPIESAAPAAPAPAAPVQ